jgi:hypothetical protein
MASPILYYIFPVVPEVPSPLWFIRFTSGYLIWATGAESDYCQANGIVQKRVNMVKSDYDRLVAEAKKNQG